MKPGPQPKPTHLKVLHGNPGKRSINKREPKPKVEIPRCPSHLNKEAKKEWKRISKDLVQLGLLSNIDRAALAGYCQAWGRWLESETLLREHGTLIKSPSGFLMQSPILAIANKALEQMRQYLNELGLSPASRSRVTAAPRNEEDDTEAFLFGKN